MKLLSLILATLLAAQAFAQTPAAAPTPFIKGDLSVRYHTRSQLDGDKPKEGIEDVYTLNVIVSNSARFKGTIAHLPYVGYSFSTQKGRMAYAVDLDVLNPANPTQSRNVGRLTGVVPIDDSNVYRFADGNLKVNVFPIGQAQGFESAFKGLALGKPPASTGMMAKLRAAKEAIAVTKLVGGQTQKINVTNYDRVALQDHVLAAGPVQIYADATINGTLLYDYDRTAWYLQNVVVTYSLRGRLEQDNLTGNIRWNKGSNRYEFDIRVDEPPPSEASVFSGPVDESAFFAVNATVPALTGSMTYKDTANRGIVTDSVVTIDLVGNGLTKEQVMYLAKLLLFTMTVPLNAE